MAGRGRSDGVPRSRARRRRSPDHGPNDMLDVYLADVGASGLSGYVATDDPHADDDTYLYRDYSAYIVVDDDFSVAQLGTSGGPGGLRATAAHEFFHAVQYAYDSGEDAWLTEGTATWMEGDGRRRRRRQPPVAAFERARASVGAHRQQPGTERVRRVALLAVPHGERRRARVDPALIRRVWELAADAPGDPDLFSAQRARGGARRARSLARRCARHVRRMEPGSGRVLSRRSGRTRTAPVFSKRHVSAANPTPAGRRCA